MVAKHAKRFLLVLGLVLLLPGVVGAAGLKAEPAEHSFWEDSAAVLGRLWDGLTEVLMGGASIDPNGKGPGPTGGALCPDCGASIDPNG